MMEDNTPKTFVTMGSFNMNKQQTSGLDFIKYLALQNKHFKLTPSGEILGMERYKENARNKSQQFSLPGEDYTHGNSINNHGLDANGNIQPQTDANAGIDGSIPDPLEVWKNIYPPHLLYPPPDNLINLHGDIIDLNQLGSDEREQAILAWQCDNIFNFSQEQSPLGYIYCLQEMAYIPEHGKMQNWAKNQVFHYDKQSNRPRAGVICSPNMNCSMLSSYTDGDVCTVLWDSGTEFGQIYVISYYGENNGKGKKDNIVISKTLRKVLNKCRNDNIKFILMGDINSWSPIWGMTDLDRSPNAPQWWRGEVWEDIMLEYHMTCLNVGNEYLL